MNNSSLCFMVAIALAGCGATRASVGVMPQATENAARPLGSGDLLYSSVAKNNIGVYTYPQGSKVAQITAVTRPGPECSDKNGNVFVDDSGYGGTDKTYEFAHGGTTPINSFNAFGFCAVDPTTNNLAVVLGNKVTVFPNESGTPTVYTDSSLQGTFYSCTYDASGNLFLMSSYFSNETLTEFRSGTFTTIKLQSSRSSYTNYGGIQWDGKYLALDYPRNHSPFPHTVERVRVSGTYGTVISTVTLDGHGPLLEEFTIANGYMATFALVHHHTVVTMYAYPAGGARKTVITHQGGSGLAVSEGG